MITKLETRARNIDGLPSFATIVDFQAYCWSLTEKINELIDEVNELKIPRTGCQTPVEEQPLMIINVKALIGSFASNAIQQSPYLVPDFLLSAIQELREAISLKTEVKILGDLEYFEIPTRIQLWRLIEEELFPLCPRILDWNEKKNPKLRISDGPDGDFIDLCALARNISNDLEREFNRL